MGGKEKNKHVTVVEKPKVINVEYQLLVAERDDLLENELAFKRRIEHLEKEAADMLQNFDILYNENKILRSKLETPEGIGADSAESYNSVYKDREHLREANRAYKRRIKQLEDDAVDSKNEYDELYNKHQLVSQKAHLETEFATRSKDEKITQMEKEHTEITQRLKMFLKEREQYEYRIAEMDKERNEMQNKLDFLSRDKHELQLRCDVLQADREKLKEKISDLEDKIPDEEQKAKEEQQFLELQAQIAALQVKTKDASIEIFNLKEENRKLAKLQKEEVETVERSLSPIIDAAALEEQREIEVKLDEVVSELGEIKKSNKYLLQENDKLKTENAIALSKLANYELELKDLQTDLSAKTTQIENMSVAIKGGQNLTDEYLILQEQLKDVNASKQALERELLQEKKLAKLRIMELENDIKNSEEKLKNTEKDSRKLENESQQLQYEHLTLTKVCEAQSLELRNMKAQIEQIQTMLEDRNRRYEEMKSTEKSANEELKENRMELHLVKRELADLKLEKMGKFGMLKQEMETAKIQRDEEKEQLRQETIRLKAEVEKLKDYEFKITTMDKEIRRLMNRIRISERYLKAPIEAKKGDNEAERKEIGELRKRQRELEKEKISLMQEKRQWEVLREKYTDLQMTNKRLVEENKRVRNDLDGSTMKIDVLEKRFRNMNAKLEEIPENGQVQKATYVDKSARGHYHNPGSFKTNRNTKNLKPIIEETTTKTVREDVGKRKVSFQQNKQRSKRKVERKSTMTAIDISKMKSKKPILPDVQSSPSRDYGYKELHKNRYQQKGTLALL